MKREERIVRDQKILELRRDGFSMKEIMREVGTTFGIVEAVCRKNGLGGKLVNLADRQVERACPECGTVFYCHYLSHQEFCSKKCQAKNARKRMAQGELIITPEMEAYAAEQVAMHDGWEYVDGYTGSDGWVNIRHLECGAVVRKSMISVRQKLNLKCPECVRRRAEERERALAEEKEAARKERIEKKLEQFTGETRAFKVCVVCGGLFFGGSSKQLCCSPECSRKHLNRLASQKKDKRIKPEKRVVNNIDLHKLFVRDKGVCQICGGMCNWNDIEDFGTYKVVGKTYPSRDHIIPIAKGGEHSWENIQLAHHGCNSRKSDRMA